VAAGAALPAGRDINARGGPMRYLLLIGSDDKAAPAPPKAEMDAMVQGHVRFGEKLRAASKTVVGGGMTVEAIVFTA